MVKPKNLSDLWARDPLIHSPILGWRRARRQIIPSTATCHGHGRNTTAFSHGTWKRFHGFSMKILSLKKKQKYTMVKRLRYCGMVIHAIAQFSEKLQMNTCQWIVFHHQKEKPVLIQWSPMRREQRAWDTIYTTRINKLEVGSSSIKHS